jgi:hypothetical protein
MLHFDLKKLELKTIFAPQKKTKAVFSIKI